MKETAKEKFDVLDNAKLQASNKCVKIQQTNIKKKTATNTMGNI